MTFLLQHKRKYTEGQILLCLVWCVILFNNPGTYGEFLQALWKNGTEKMQSCLLTHQASCIRKPSCRQESCSPFASIFWSPQPGRLSLSPVPSSCTQLPVSRQKWQHLCTGSPKLLPGETALPRPCHCSLYSCPHFSLWWAVAMLQPAVRRSWEFILSGNVYGFPLQRWIWPTY